MIRERGNTNGDVALALLFYGGLAGGVLLTGLAGQSAARLQQYLFGSITTISVADVIVDDGAGRGRGRDLRRARRRSCSRSPRTRSSPGSPGCNVRVYNLLVAVLAAVSVTVAMRTVGLLLVSALMVVPVATAQQLTRSFRTTLAAAMVLGVVASVGGPARSRRSHRPDANVAPGPTIVLLALAGFVVTWPVGVWLRRRQRLRAPFPADPDVPPLDHVDTEEHPHEHGPDCGHLAVQHGDHVDYVHDGHRHAAHGEHYDEH